MGPLAALGTRGTVLALLLAGCVPVPVAPRGMPAPAPPPASAAPVAAVEAEVHELVNRHRASRGLPPLAHDERVAEIARRHSRAMAEGRLPFGHDGFDGRAEAIGALFPLRSMAENVAYDGRPEVAARTVEGWIRSPGHRANLEGDFDVTGVGVARAADGTHYFTQIFASRR